MKHRRWSGMMTALAVVLVVACAPQAADKLREAEQEWHDAVEVLEEKHRAAVAELDKIEREGGEAWTEMRHGFVAAYHDLQDANRRAAAHLENV